MSTSNPPLDGHSARGLAPAVSASERKLPPLSPRILILFALLAALLLSGCLSSNPQTTFDPRSEFAADLLDLLVLIFWPALLVFVVVEGILLFTIFKYRQRPQDRRPEQIHGSTRLEIAWTIAPAVVLAFIAVPTVQTIFETQAPAREGSLRVEVIGRQWWWEIRYPDLGITTANEMWVPVGTTVALDQVAADVIHSFWVPAMGGKRDMFPNHVTKIWWTPSAEGVYLGQCAEYCGDSHAYMRVRVVAASPERFQQWVEDQKRDSVPPSQDELVQKGHQLVTAGACAGCHTIQGTPAQGKIGPSLTHVGSRLTIAAGIFPNDKEHLRRWVRNAPKEKPGVKMPNVGLTEKEAEAVAEYLLTLK